MCIWLLPGGRICCPQPHLRQPADLNTPECPVFDLSVHLGGRHNLGKNLQFYLEEFQEHRVPCKTWIFINHVREAFETSVTCSFLPVRRFNEYVEGFATREGETHINDARLDGVEQEIVFLVTFANSFVLVDQPAWFHTG